MFEHLLHTNMRYILSVMLHTKMYYGRTYVTHKNMMSYFSTFLHMKMCNVHFVFTFFRIRTAAYQNVPKGSRERVSFTCF